MGLRDIGATLPPGFRFYPSDEELVCHYLYKKIANEDVLKGTLVEIDLHTCEPWQLPEAAKLSANEWYFFNFRDRKYATGFRTNRATTSGYWKATGKDRTVVDPRTQEIVGMRKTLVFYRNRAPNGIKSDWIMHEFRLESPHMPPKEDWVLCRVFHKSKGGENSTRLSSQMMLEPSIHAPYLIDQTTMACGYLPSKPPHQGHGQNLLNLLQYNSHHEKDNNDNNDNRYINEISSKFDDDYEFLWNMNMDENNLGDHHHEFIHGVASNVDDVRLGIDNSMILL
ncbi:NAC domain-containing protein 21/22 [Hibiscus syriacus]|uniref:NAC domain-containing protein 21/22 n=1 Tax=Hibiscus syriacus TaxID=106335 RepID=A0A6A3CMF4_HIBSY|nr:protein CUP-SHAPED COTYLEDON 3-like [Hibiscus syriacus]KAE8730625.1 NAC domain-containing protein 21/22 [Hibiscus syriacus]